MTVYIYGLYCPFFGDLRYIGKSIKPKDRLRRHLDQAKNPKNYNQRWIATLARSGGTPVLSVLHEVAECEDWREVERSHIANALARGERLTNTAAGGEGIELLSPEIEAQRCDRINQTWAGTEIRRRHSDRIREATGSEAYRKRRAEQSTSLWSDDAYAAKVRRGVRSAYASDKARQAQSERSKLAHACPEVEVRRSRSLSAAWERVGARDSRKAAMREAQKRDDVLAKKSAATKRRWRDDPAQREKFEKVMSDPEMIARRNAAIKAGWARRLAERREAEGGQQ